MLNKSCLKYILAAFLLLLSSNALFPQNIRQMQPMDRSKQAFGPSLFSFDSYFFKAKDDATKNRLEVYVAFANDILQFVKERQGNFSARYELVATVFDKKGNLTDELSETRDLTAANFGLTNDKSLRNKHHFVFNLMPAEYKLVLQLTDNDTQKALKREIKIEEKSFDFSFQSFLGIVVG